jgi:hypothetical protein
MNIEDACAALRDNAKPHSTGYCARHVRQAMEAGGLSTDGRPVDARAYGPFLASCGFHCAGANELPAELRAGDIIVVQPYPDGHPSGHIAMFDGDVWISDFQQRDHWGGPGFRNNEVPFEVYRFGPAPTA